ncbi:MAG: FAD-dependent oxidoreductase [Proteobacteria bacterium]|nr:FAD-dependent oxidoreductase [Pseudomonadota bacterium]
MRASSDRLNIAVVGTGIAGMSAAWLLSTAHDVTVYEQATRLGGHTNTIDVTAPGGTTLPVDMGFIVFNPETYPNLVALFDHLGVATQASDMSLGLSLRGGALEYAGSDLNGLFAQRSNLLRPRFWAMLRDLVRFYREAARDARGPEDDSLSLGAYLRAGGFGEAFVRDHLLPMAAAIWSTPADRMLDHPAAAFLRFCDNHGLLRLSGRPQWRTVTGGSRRYIEKLTAPYAARIRLGCPVRSVRRSARRVEIVDGSGAAESYDHVVIAAHSDQALAMLADPSPAETALLGAIRYGHNEAVMHRDAALMPRRRAAWSSWNYIGGSEGEGTGAPLCATYWMNRLQSLPGPDPVLVTLNAPRAPRAGTVIHRESYAHPQFDAAAMRAQRDLWSLQGVARTWYCGAWFGAGFHEDGLQAGLAVAEALGGVRRPWTVANPSGRLYQAPEPRHWELAA